MRSRKTSDPVCIATETMSDAEAIGAMEGFDTNATYTLPNTFVPWRNQSLALRPLALLCTTHTLWADASFEVWSSTSGLGFD